MGGGLVGGWVGGGVGSAAAKDSTYITLFFFFSSFSFFHLFIF